MANLQQALSFRPFAPEEVNLENFQILTRGINEHRRLKFSYKNLGANRAQSRRVNAYHMACADNRWYIIGYDTARKGMRTFSLTRMKKVELLPDVFDPPTDCMTPIAPEETADVAAEKPSDMRCGFAWQERRSEPRA